MLASSFIRSSQVARLLLIVSGQLLPCFVQFLLRKIPVAAAIFITSKSLFLMKQLFITPKFLVFRVTERFSELLYDSTQWRMVGVLFHVAAECEVIFAQSIFHQSS
jgi:hypothetical protein